MSELINRGSSNQTLLEEELYTTKQILESFTENTLDPICIINTQKRILRTNQAFENVFGYSFTDIQGSILPIIPDFLQEQTDMIHSEILSGRQIIGFETLRKHKNGNLIPVSITFSTIKDRENRLIGLSFIYRDISVQKRTEAALRESEAKYRIIAENMTDLIGMIDAKGITRYVSPSVQSILGFFPSKYEGNSLFDFVHPSEFQDVIDEFQNTLKNKKPNQLEIKLQNSQDVWIILEARAVPVLDETGQVNQILIIGRDISERKKNEELLRRSEKLSVVGELAAGVAHEIRNPLASIKGFLQLLMRNPHKQEQYIEIMQSELERIQYFASELLVLAKPQFIEFKQHELIKLLKSVVTLLETQAILNNVRIETYFLSNTVLLFCDENQLKQVFINLIKNAIESFTNEGIVSIEVNLLNTSEVQVRIHDSGCGISEEILQKLGEPFYTTKEKGTGLGLMVSHKIIENHHGKLQFHSQIHQGTTVTLTLPISPSIT